MWPVDRIHLALSLSATLALEYHPEAAISTAIATLYADPNPQRMRAAWLELITHLEQTRDHGPIRDALLGLDEDSIQRRRHNPFKNIVQRDERPTLLVLTNDEPKLLEERDYLASRLPCSHEWKINGGDPACFAVNGCGLYQSRYFSLPRTLPVVERLEDK